MTIRTTLAALILAAVVLPVHGRADEPATRPAVAVPDLDEMRLPWPIQGTVPLDDALEVLRGIDGLHVQVQWSQLQLAGVNRETEVELDLPAGTTVRLAFDLILDAAAGGFAALAAEMRGPLVLVTTRQAADHAVETRLYDLRPLLDAMSDGRDQTEPTPTAEEVLQLVLDTVDAGSWKVNGGTVGTMTEVGGVLVVTTAPSTHAAVRDLLLTLSNGFGAPSPAVPAAR